MISGYLNSVVLNETLLLSEVKYLTEEAKGYGLHYATPGSAGLDLRALGCNRFGVKSGYVLLPGEQVVFKTGVAIQLPNPNFVGKVYVRSSIGIKKGLSLANGTGIIDSDYQGEILVCLKNNSREKVTIEHGERIAQYVVVPCLKLQLKVVDEFSNATERGEGGIGSTGTIEVEKPLEVKGCKRLKPLRWGNQRT